MTLQTTVKSALVGAAIFAAPFLVQPAPALAWDERNVCIPCNTDPEIPYNKKKGESIKVRWDNAGHTSVTIIRFLDRSKIEADEHAIRYHFSTTGNSIPGDCKLQVKVTSKSVSVSASGGENNSE